MMNCVKWLTGKPSAFFNELIELFIQLPEDWVEPTTKSALHSATGS
jgi:hypothetical protein